MAKPISLSSGARAQGFTLIELMVTLAVAAVLVGLAAPSIRDFIVRSKMTGIGNEFTASVLRARNDAINRNTCVTLCMSSSAGSPTPACTTAGEDWQVGWIAFLNTSCNSGATGPATAIDLIVARASTGDDVLLQSQSSVKKMMFNPRGAPKLSAATEFDLIYQTTGHPYTERFGFNICLDALGRTRTVPSDKTCASY